MEKGKILLIEENKKDADWALNLLQGEGYSITCVYNGRDSLKKAEEERYSLVILDPVLPDMSGEEVCSLLRRKRRYKNVPVLILSVKDDVEDIETAFAKGVDDYIIKPPRAQHLLSKVERYTSGQRKER